MAWLLDLDIAPWSSPHRICFSVAWGVTVPGMDAALGDPEPNRFSVRDCPVSGHLGAADDHDVPRWFELRDRPWPLPSLLDPFVVQGVLGSVHRELVPVLSALDRPAAVQARIHDSLDEVHGAPSAAELRAIRRIAAISLLDGERGNALRWLDHLRARLELAMAPEVAAERVEPLRRLCLAS